MKHIIIISTLAAVMPASLSATTLVDTVVDYSNSSQGINGLSYGYYTSSEAETGVFSTDLVVPLGGDWAGAESFSTARFDATTQHPAVDTLRPAVRRYTVGSSGEPLYSGQVMIVGSFGGPAPGGGGNVIGFVTVDDTILYSSPANGSLIASFSLLASVAPGSTIDFGIRAAGDPSFDSTLFSATITAIPEPSSFASLAGLLVLGFTAGKRRRTRTTR